MYNLSSFCKYIVKKINTFSIKSLKDYLILKNSNNNIKLPEKFKPFKDLLKKIVIV